MGYSQTSEPIRLERDCDALQLRAGIPTHGEDMTTVADFTVAPGERVPFVLTWYRSHEEPPPALELAEGAGDEDVEKLVWQQLRTCFDPEIPINIVELGLVYTCAVERLDDGKRKVNVEMTLTAPGCGMGEILVDDVRTKLEMIPTVAEADVELVFDPPWNHSMMSEAAKLETGMF